MPTRQRIAARLCLSPRTIEFYLGNMRKKLGCTNKTQLINIALNSEFAKHMCAAATS